MGIKQDIVISLINVSKKYRSPIQKNDFFYAIKDLNLSVKKGDKVGLMGDNGAGKTTLLKLIAGITTPTTGSVCVFGKTISLINLEAGFNEELTGEENILINGMLYDMSESEIVSAKNEIINFADIGSFINAPFFTYSSGMRFRLALAVALAAKPDIILMDEVFMSGDINFQIKTLKKIEEITKNKKVTLIMASHHPLILRKYCTRFLYIRNGKILKSSIHSVLSLTKKWNKYFSDINQT